MAVNNTNITHIMTKNYVQNKLQIPDVSGGRA